MIARERYTIFRIPTSVICFSIFIVPYVVMERIDLCEYDSYTIQYNAMFHGTNFQIKLNLCSPVLCLHPALF